ncbi:hypothetical protein EMIHUDRAFT_218295 [Emiliania huxleyi CCMP1516]|uniref:Uncharacterized protein n=3 Tax=Emiliania huxleyi TaxID=2903 RepID=A0A0D3I907_EMIH1|nr:hypothetical protein EMIHUDRAFT_218295 [Emiliania huxleyi CCMP1516]EOD07742.1 hypothetical protein EMIHUDRAFT_218295 [Emiliania huxleyi CCMP1516]|eukprot:XP_005760171.1 hypothetical protein EMIHUDRAFT_218295 [Emiliania huxleyi CCMP1516]
MTAPADAEPPPPVETAALCVPPGATLSGKARAQLLDSHTRQWQTETWEEADHSLVRRLVDRSVAWANRSTVAVGCLGGSGSRGLAELLFRHGVYMGHCLNPSTMDCAYFAVHDRPPLAQVMQSVFTGPASAGSLDYQLHQLPAAVLAAAERALGAALQRVWSDLRSELYCYYRNRLLRARRSRADAREDDLYAPPFHAIGWKACKSLVLLPVLRSLLGRKLRFMHLMRHGPTMMLSTNNVQLRQSCAGGNCGSALSTNRSVYTYDTAAVASLHAECLALSQKHCSGAQLHKALLDRPCGALQTLMRQGQLWAAVNSQARDAAERGGPRAAAMSYRSVRIEDVVRGVGVASLLEWVGVPPAAVCPEARGGLNTTCWRDPSTFRQEESVVEYMVRDKMAALVAQLRTSAMCPRVAGLYSRLGDGCGDAYFRRAMVRFGYWTADDGANCTESRGS